MAPRSVSPADNESQREMEEKAAPTESVRIHSVGSGRSGTHKVVPSPRSYKRMAFVTYSIPSDDAFILNACVLGRRLKDEGVQSDRVLMVPFECFDSDGVLLPVFSVFHECFDSIRAMKHPPPTARFPYYYFKIQAFSLTEYDRILFLEPYCITNDDQLELYCEERSDRRLPASPRWIYEAMLFEPNRPVFEHLMARTYGAAEVLGVGAVADLVRGAASWSEIENATDKNEWFYNVLQSEVTKGTASQSFVVAYFADADPWDLDAVGNGECTAVAVWMETARALIAESKGISTVVNPEILKAIVPDVGGKKEAQSVTANEDQKAADSVEEHSAAGDVEAAPRSEARSVAAAPSLSMAKRRLVLAAAPPPEPEDSSTDSSESDVPPPPPSYFVKRSNEWL